ncbi:MAG: hypothetical protein KDN22_23640 [Verrucomicrobiae bacterium]|nr:hypothetical protein [Verrucomicrobiae bacterium]
MVRLLKLLGIFVLPVWLLDGCLHRDPLYYLDEKSQLIAPWPSAPLSFDFHDRAGARSGYYQIHDVTEFLMNGSVFTGKTGEEYFVVRRSDGNRTLFATAADRDATLAASYSTKVADLKGIPWHSALRANFFYPYNLIYYLGATCIIAFICLRRRGRVPESRRRRKRRESY